jgi:hypothetical protein
MKPILMGVVLAAGVAMAAPAATAQGAPVVSNGSGETLNCRVSPRGRSGSQTILLRAGQSWSPRSGPASYVLYCDPPAAEIRYRLRPGASYRLVPEPSSRKVVLRRL